ncbi:unnamed protein product, partial [Effrenium voratum]
GVLPGAAGHAGGLERAGAGAAGRGGRTVPEAVHSGLRNGGACRALGEQRRAALPGHAEPLRGLLGRHHLCATAMGRATKQGGRTLHLVWATTL